MFWTVSRNQGPVSNHLKCVFPNAVQTHERSNTWHFVWGLAQVTSAGIVTAIQSDVVCMEFVMVGCSISTEAAAAVAAALESGKTTARILKFLNCEFADGAVDALRRASMCTSVTSVWFANDEAAWIDASYRRSIHADKMRALAFFGSLEPKLARLDGDHAVGVRTVRWMI